MRLHGGIEIHIGLCYCDYQYYYHRQMNCLQGKLPVCNLLKDRFFGFSPHKSYRGMRNSACFCCCRHLRSAARGDIVVPCSDNHTMTLGRRTFAVYGPVICNGLSTSFRNTELSLNCFRRKLNTIYFSRGYWLRCTVVKRRSLTGELSLTHDARSVADGWPLMWVYLYHPLQGQPTRPTQPFILSRSIDK